VTEKRKNKASGVFFGGGSSKKTPDTFFLGLDARLFLGLAEALIGS